MSESVIRVDGLRKSFGGPPVLDGISFEVRPGETFALLGRNGAGKTTTIRILLGLLKPDAGSVNVAGLRSAGSGRSMSAAASAISPKIRRCTNG